MVHHLQFLKAFLVGTGLLAATPMAVLAQSSQAEPLFVGSINDVSGFAATLGTQNLGGQKLAVEMVNEAGGINGRRVEVVERDTQGDVNRTVQYFEELAGDPKISAIVGFTTSNDAIAVKDIANRAKTSMIAMVGSPAYTADDISYLYRIVLSEKYLAPALLKFISEEGGKRIALLFQNDAFGQGALGIVESVYKDYGLEVVAAERFGPKDNDVTPQLLRIKEAEPDFIVSYATGLVSAVINRNRQNLGISDIPLIGPQNWGDGAVINASAGAAEGTFIGSSVAVADPKPGPQADFFALHTQKFGAPPPNANVMYGFQGMAILLDALKKVAPVSGPVDRVALNKALEETDYDGPTGHFKFSSTVHELVDPEAVVIGVIKDGNWIRYDRQAK